MITTKICDFATKVQYVHDVGAAAARRGQPPNPNPTRAMPAAMPFLSIAFDLISFLLRIASLVDFCRNHW